MHFLVNALIAGLALAVVAGPLGCFVVWRRMAYFGDTLAHSALLGITFGILLDINITLAITIGCIGVSGLMMLLMKNQSLASDTLLGILAHSSLALGLVAISFMDNVRIDLNGLLFGDLLAIGSSELWWAVGGSVLVLTLVLLLWNRLLMITVDEDQAQVEGLNVGLLKFALMFLLSFVIAVAMKIVGVLLITSMLIIPAAAARKISTTPESMAARASAIGAIAVIAGLMMSWFLDTPAGPSIVCCAFFIFLLIYVAKKNN
jgi:zinc transport system permease protein